MDDDQHLTLLTNARNQYHWAIANLAIGLVCVALAAFLLVQSPACELAERVG
jgi:hypothetical protein